MRMVYSLLFTAAVAAATAFFMLPAGDTGRQETAYERVMRTGTLRCGYVHLEPLFIVDPNTKSLSGIYKDVVEEVAKSLSLKVDWTAEIAPAEMSAALNTGRVDAMCVGLWLTGARARVMQPTEPIVYSPVVLAVRADDHRFDSTPEALNNPQYTIAIVDGTSMAQVARQRFSRAKQFTLPEMMPLSEMLVAVTNGKADFAAGSYDTILKFMAKNPNKMQLLKQGASSKPYIVATVPWVIYVGKHEQALADSLNGGLAELRAFNMIDPIIARYEPAPDTYKRVPGYH